MDQNIDTLLGFAPDHDAPIPYMQRTRDYYRAIGYTTPYRWAHHVDAPFTTLTKPLRDSRVALITTAALYQPDKGDQGPGAAYNGSAKFYAVYSGDISAHTTCASRISATTASTPPRPTAAPGSRCPRCCAPSPPGASARWRNASTARRPTAAIA